MNKFKEREVLEVVPNKTKTNRQKKYMRIQSGLEQVSNITPGLKGGAPSSNANLGNYSTNDLQLINRGSDCFVNCVIQLLRCTAYAKFLKVHLPDLITNTSPDSYRLSKRLHYIYNQDVVGPKSVAFIRTHVAQMSGKRYLDNNTQQNLW